MKVSIDNVFYPKKKKRHWQCGTGQRDNCLQFSTVKSIKRQLVELVQRDAKLLLGIETLSMGLCQLVGGIYDLDVSFSRPLLFRVKLLIKCVSFVVKYISFRINLLQNNTHLILNDTYLYLHRPILLRDQIISRL